MHQLDQKRIDIIDARCNHEDTCNSITTSVTAAAAESLLITVFENSDESAERTFTTTEVHKNQEHARNGQENGGKF